jgi:hypothetical protein
LVPTAENQVTPIKAAATTAITIYVLTRGMMIESHS